MGLKLAGASPGSWATRRRVRCLGDQLASRRDRPLVSRLYRRIAGCLLSVGVDYLPNGSEHLVSVLRRAHEKVHPALSCLYVDNGYAGTVLIVPTDRYLCVVLNVLHER